MVMQKKEETTAELLSRLAANIPAKAGEKARYSGTNMRMKKYEKPKQKRRHVWKGIK